MRTSQSFGVHFTIKKDKAKDGVTNVYACITLNKDRIHFALKHYVKVENWDNGRGGLKVKVPEAKDTNAYLEEVKFTITTYYQQLQIAGKEITPLLLKAMFLGGGNRGNLFAEQTDGLSPRGCIRCADLEHA